MTPYMHWAFGTDSGGEGYVEMPEMHGMNSVIEPAARFSFTGKAHTGGIGDGPVR